MTDTVEENENNRAGSNIDLKDTENLGFQYLIRKV